MKSHSYLVALMLMVSVFVQAQNPNYRNLLIEDLTSTICGHCPCFDTLLEKAVVEPHPGTVVLALHSSMSAYASLYSDSLPALLAFHSSPSGVVNRQCEDIQPEPLVDTVNAIYARDPLSPVKISITNKTFIEAARQLSFDLAMEAVTEMPDADYRLHVLIVENKLVGYQQHFPECPGGDHYEHNNVLRQMAYPIYGKRVHQGNWDVGVAVNQAVSLTLDAGWVPQNCDIIAYVATMDSILYLSKVQQVIREKATGPIGTIELEESTICTIHPNPANQRLNIHLKFSSSRNATVSLLNIKGQHVATLAHQVFPAGYSNLQVPLPRLANDTYLVQIESVEGVFYQKVTIVQ